MGLPSVSSLFPGNPRPNEPLLQVIYKHHTLPIYVHVCNNIRSQNIGRRYHACFLFDNIFWDGTLRCSFISTKSASRFYNFLTLNLNAIFLIPIDTLFVSITLLFVTGLNHDIIFLLFSLRAISLSIALIKYVGQRGIDRNQGDLRLIHRTEYLVKLKVSP